jgi:hypothetical protein
MAERTANSSQVSWSTPLGVAHAGTGWYLDGGVESSIRSLLEGDLGISLDYVLDYPMAWSALVTVTGCLGSHYRKKSPAAPQPACTALCLCDSVIVLFLAVQ